MGCLIADRIITSARFFNFLYNLPLIFLDHGVRIYCLFLLLSRIQDKIGILAVSTLAHGGMTTPFGCLVDQEIERPVWIGELVLIELDIGDAEPGVAIHPNRRRFLIGGNGFFHR